MKNRRNFIFLGFISFLSACTSNKNSSKDLEALDKLITKITNQDKVSSKSTSKAKNIIVEKNNKKIVVLKVNSSRRDELVARALLAVNSPYRYGGNSLEQGFDCSGLIQYVVKAVVPNQILPRSTKDWANFSKAVNKRNLKRGDFVFFNTARHKYSHMGIFIGDNQFVHSPATGGRVRKELLTTKYFAKRFTDSRTIFN